MIYFGPTDKMTPLSRQLVEAIKELESLINELRDENKVIRDELSEAVRRLEVNKKTYNTKMAEPESVQMLLKFIEDNYNCSKSDIYALPCFSKNRTSRIHQYNARIEAVEKYVKEEGFRLVVLLAPDGKSLRHRIITTQVDELDEYETPVDKAAPVAVTGISEEIREARKKASDDMWDELGIADS